MPGIDSMPGICGMSGAIVCVRGRKRGMTQVSDRSGEAHAATVIEAGPCLVIQVKTPDTDGYHAIQVGYGGAKRSNSPDGAALRRSSAWTRARSSSKLNGFTR